MNYFGLAETIVDEFKAGKGITPVSRGSGKDMLMEVTQRSIEARIITSSDCSGLY